MIVTVAKTAGFCFGVERAVEKAEALVASGEKAYSYGPVVHNEAVTEDLKQKGLEIISSEEELQEMQGGRVLIRAHGVPESTLRLMQAHFDTVEDATCPFVGKIHTLVEKASLRGENVLIIGDPRHPEVTGIAGWCKGPYFVAETAETLDEMPFPKDEKLFVVVQTTFQIKKLKNILEKIAALGYNANIANTVCSATRERQEEAAALARRSDVMLVIGSETSSNSRKLYEICKELCDHTHFIQKADDLQPVWFHNVKRVGITAGASTPRKIIEEVQNDVRV